MLVSGQIQHGAVILIIDLLGWMIELPAQITVANGARLVDPPIGFLMAVSTRPLPGEDKRLSYEVAGCAVAGLMSPGIAVGSIARIVGAVGKHELPAQRQQRPGNTVGILVFFSKVEAKTRKGIWRQVNGCQTPVQCLHRNYVVSSIVRLDIAGDSVGESKRAFHGRSLSEFSRYPRLGRRFCP